MMMADPGKLYYQGPKDNNWVDMGATVDGQHWAHDTSTLIGMGEPETGWLRWLIVFGILFAVLGVIGFVAALVYVIVLLTS